MTISIETQASGVNYGHIKVQAQYMRGWGFRLGLCTTRPASTSRPVQARIQPAACSTYACTHLCDVLLNAIEDAVISSTHGAVKTQEVRKEAVTAGGQHQQGLQHSRSYGFASPDQGPCKSNWICLAASHGRQILMAGRLLTH